VSTARPSPKTDGEVTSKELDRSLAPGVCLVAFLNDGAPVHRIAPGATITVGRSADCDVQIDRVGTLSRRHFAVRDGSQRVVRDLGGMNGTKVGGVPLRPHEDTPIELGALIEAGGVFFMLRDRDPHAMSPSTPDVSTHASTSAVVIEDPSMARLHHLVAQIARSAMPVLIVGETGVGKEIFATAVHAQSPRAQNPMVRINCAALPESLLESELFGYEKGAFTGASQRKRGLIESADGGSFFLDEIGELPLTTQAKLLRVLESGEIMRLGALAPRTIDVRFIAATNRHLPSIIAKGGFRRDLYYRLNGITIPIPPLRDRVAEIEKLAELFLSLGAKRAHRRPHKLSKRAVAMLEQHSWPGNIRELKNVMDRAMTVTPGDTIDADAILLDREEAPPELRAGEPPTMASIERTIAPPSTTGEPRGRLVRQDRETECALILQALEEAGGHQTRAAEILGISRRTLINRLDEYGLKRPRKS
jgi:two-component system response regulator AtoC